MNPDKRLIITLKEYENIALEREEFSDDLGKILWNRYRNQVQIEYPTPKTEYMWQLISQGWVGYIPLTNDLHLSLQPKIPLSNLFQMLEYAYNLKNFKFIQGLMDSASLEDFYERLAVILAKRILDRGKKGFYRSYLEYNERMAYIRGRIDLNNVLSKPWDSYLLCHYQDHTPDIDDNQLLAWTLYHIPRSGMCSSRSLPFISRAYRSLMGLVSLVPKSPSDCLYRLYNRLNDDYHPMHCLCRFFLEQTGPSHQMGDHTFIPFLVDMSRLYEKFVAEWIKINLPENFLLKTQENIQIGLEKSIEFNIDLVIYDKNTNLPLYILDTKYKIPDSISTADLSQVVTYAEAKSCKEAILIYPTSVKDIIDERIGNIHVRTLSFCIDDDLDDAGEEFLRELFKECE
ncbi:MAG: restriction endonuclease [Candidatus Lokiarchaeota archaeon]|nr:restriction endonuclease [Candidatus Lokiarchaeota archaeon]